MSIDQQGFSYVCDLVRSHSGVVLEAGKEYLVEARLRPLAESAGQCTVQSFIERLRSTAPGNTHWNVVEAMTTNETSFFRDTLPFVNLRTTVLPALIAARSAERTLLIWSGACSTGQEPYSVAMIIREYFPELESWTCRIRATDLARKVIARACRGAYSQVEINRGMPADLLMKYFKRERLEWIVREDLRKMVEFSEFNLTRPWPVIPAPDLILLRNVLIYFDVATKRRILTEAHRQLRPDGFLLLGNSETTMGIDERFERVAGDSSGWHRPRA